MALTKAVQEAADMAIPEIKSSAPSKPWWTPKLKGHEEDQSKWDWPNLTRIELENVCSSKIKTKPSGPDGITQDIITQDIITHDFAATVRGQTSNSSKGVVSKFQLRSA
ncbi:hypothetical protein BJ878DRAFT_553154 [Calycina marina]|uniref:Uncharacterized protein n=1 Tax=Calycina marina TaxID=1763456 RepID=A0A9P8CDS3_9HELO|nr:hypothetical protein BJ878DRAFT_553154 [Calycina marina]